MSSSSSMNCIICAVCACVENCSHLIYKSVFINISSTAIWRVVTCAIFSIIYKATIFQTQITKILSQFNAMVNYSPVCLSPTEFMCLSGYVNVCLGFWHLSIYSLVKLHSKNDFRAINEKNGIQMTSKTSTIFDHMHWIWSENPQKSFVFVFVPVVFVILFTLSLF